MKRVINKVASKNIWAKIVVIGSVVLFLISGCGRSKKAKRQGELFEHHSSLGISYLDQRKYSDAVTEFRKALEINPNHLPTIVNLGLTYHHQLKYDDAVKTFQRALEIDPNEPYSHYNLGLIYYARRRFERAANELEKVVAVDPNDPAARYNLAMVYFKQGRLDEAEKQFRTVIKLYPDSSSAYYGLSRALMDAGKKGEVKEVLQKFRELKNMGRASSEKDKYLREGKYLEPMIPIETTSLRKERVAKKPSSVRFVDITSGANLKFRHGGSGTNPPESIPASEYTPAYIKSKIVSSLGSGAVLFDYDNDSNLDLYISNCSDSKEESVNALYHNNGDGTFTDVTRKAGVGDTSMSMGCVVGDYDNDGDFDLYVTNYGKNILYRNNGDGTFTDVTDIAGVGDAGFSAGAAFGDYDADGDIDLYVANYIDFEKTPPGESFRFPHDFSGQSNRLYRNNGNNTFTDVTAQAGVGGKGKSLNIVFTDYDNDRDIDIYVVNDGEPNILYANNRDGTFTDITSTVGIGEISGAGVAVGDYDNDANMDIFITGGQGKSNILYHSNGTEFMKMDSQLGEGGWGAGFLDYDNDSDVDIFVTGDRNRLFQNNGGGNFADVSENILGESDSPGGGRGVTFGDYDNDGDTDIVLVNNGGTPTLLRNEGGDKNNWLKVVVIGAASNRSGIGAKVEMKVGRLWQKREILAGSGYFSQNSLTAEFGLSDRGRVDVLGITWPSGIKQFVPNVPANLRTTITEELSTSTSCPHLYVWDGSKYRFITDFLGVGALGYLVEPGIYYYPDSDEYIKIAGASFKPKDGLYSLQILDSLQEVIYLDEVRLLTIDHPAEVDVYPNERFALLPPFPEFKICAVKRAKPPVSAVDADGNDILPLIRNRDRKYPNFKLLPYKGYAETHSMILDLGDLSTAKKIVLIIYGWIEYPESYSNLAASQGNVKIKAPSVEVINKDGEWETVMEIMGFPAGFPKTMTVDLTDKFLTENYKIRITTNLEIYWDEILVSIFSDEVPMTVTTLEPFNAHLHWKGYPKYSTPDGKKPYIYAYDDANGAAFWNDQQGNYTKYGDVTELLTKTDDKFVIMRHGDEITVNFDAKRLPKLPSGWSRDFFFYADGFSKDMDLNTACSSTVEPLPFHGMSSYPYPKEESYPFDEEHLKYIKEYNTRYYH